VDASRLNLCTSKDMFLDVLLNRSVYNLGSSAEHFCYCSTLSCRCQLEVCVESQTPVSVASIPV
jgi:hypothetical protein